MRSILLKGLCGAGLYPIPFPQYEFLADSASFPPTYHSCFLGQHVNSTLWHRRLGHLSNTITFALLRQSQVSFTSDGTKTICTTYLEGKLAKLKFPSSAMKSITPLEVIHSDVLGHSLVLSVKGFRYYVSFIDECTRFTWIFPMVNKSKVYSIFVNFHAFLIT